MWFLYFNLVFFLYPHDSDSCAYLILIKHIIYYGGLIYDNFYVLLNFLIEFYQSQTVAWGCCAEMVENSKKMKHQGELGNIHICITETSTLSYPISDFPYSAYISIGKIANLTNPKKL